MKGKVLSSIVLLGAAAILAFMFSVLCLSPQPTHAASLRQESSPSPAEEYSPEAPVTVITVTSGTDPDNSASKSCLTATPCTLRRAIVQARNVPAAQRPVLIRFNIPKTQAENYVSAVNAWRIPLLTTTDASVLRRLNGKIIIDGSTQPGGRTTGPKIILLGPGTGAKDGIVVGDVAGNDANEIRSLAFQNFKTHLYVNTNLNIIANNWFGLTDDGQDVFLRGDNPKDGGGNTGVALSEASTNNLIQNNVFAGIVGVAAAIRGDTNTFKNNYIGTIADGSVPNKQTDPTLVCTPVDWLGGGGISVNGDNHLIDNNTFAGLRNDVSVTSIQPDAIRLGSGNHSTVQRNKIGVDATSTKIGVCGRGIYLSDSPKSMQVLSNTIVESGLSSISLNGALYDGNTLRNNLIEKSNPWGQIEGSPMKEDTIQRGISLPSAYLAFNPAKVTSINGTKVSGTNGDGSTCRNCTIELYLDNSDLITETLQLLAAVKADANGNWSATLPAKLSEGQGIRTMSTTVQYNTISGMSAGTTTGLSNLYGSKIKLYLPMLRRKN